ncbi:MAG: helix-turn-helix domain-containing protein [Acidobacteria bacterium]|nr:helix-turn-helix domain-containing protein [Acidobacteriota bacterium]
MLKGSRPLPDSYPKPLNTLGDHLRKKRLNLGLLQREVAKQIGVNLDTIWNWESNATTPSLPMMPGIIGFLGYSPCVGASSLAEKLAVYRRTRGLSRKELAEQLGVDPGTLARWEGGTGKPGRKHLERIEDCFSAR